jgi:hypothetical protein
MSTRPDPDVEAPRVAAGLRFLADAVEHDAWPIRTRRVDNRTVLPTALHDAVCSRRIATPQNGDEGDILGCSFCGLLYERPLPGERS